MRHEIILSSDEGYYEVTSLVDGVKRDIKPEKWFGMEGLDMQDDAYKDAIWRKEIESDIERYVKLVSEKCGFVVGDTIHVIVCEYGNVCVRDYCVTVR